MSDEREMRHLKQRVSELEMRARGAQIHQVWTGPNAGVAADMVALGSGNLAIVVQPIPLTQTIEAVRMGAVAQRTGGTPTIAMAIYRARIDKIDRENLVSGVRPSMDFIAAVPPLLLSTANVTRYRGSLARGAWMDPAIGAYYVAVMSDDQAQTTWFCPGAGGLAANLQAARAEPAATAINSWPAQLQVTGSSEDTPAVVLWSPTGVYLFGRDGD